MTEEAIKLGRSLVAAMRSRRRDTLSMALRDIDDQAIRAGQFGGSRQRLLRKQAAEQELINRASEIWKALRRACEVSSIPFSDGLPTSLKSELHAQLTADKELLETKIAPSSVAAAWGDETIPADLTDAFSHAVTQLEPEIDLFSTALKNGVASGYAYSSDPKATAMAIPQKSEGTPLVFISYSHDSDEHKAWVRWLAENLVRNGIDVILDQWHLKHGRDLALFMEKGITTADYVLMICTEEYVAKANERAGGVGYESLFLTGELLRKVDTGKLVPVIRQSSHPRQRPAFVTSRLFADLSDGPKCEVELEDLLRSLHDAPRYQPPTRGASPFARAVAAAQSTEAPLPANGGATAISELPVLPLEVFDLGKRTIATRDVLAWNQIREKALVASRQGLFNWRATAGKKLPGDVPSAKSWTFDLLSTHSSVIALALVAALSADDRFTNHASLIDRVINPDDWEGSGVTTVVESPRSIGWAIHLLAGAALAYTERLDAAFSLARSKVHLEHEPKMIVECHTLTGWPPTLKDSKEAWSFITDLRGNWPWLDTVFGEKRSYRAMLATYSLALSITEFAERLRRGELFANYDAQASRLWVPLRFLGEDGGLQQRAYQAVSSHPAAIRALFPAATIRDIAPRQWTHWLSFCAQASRSEYQSGGAEQLARYADLVPSALRH